MKANERKYDGSSLRRITLAGMLVTVGIVFGDIGTSPLYVMKAIVGVNPGYDADYIIGAISCVIWTLTLQTTVKYVLIALRADNKGEGGILALFALLRRQPRGWLYIVAAVGAAMLVADGVITPAITVTTAVEGLRIVAPATPVLPIVIGVILLIFMMQRVGTGRIGRCFGPFMLAWFLMLGVLGAVNLPACPEVLKAFNPWYAVKLLVSSPSWFMIMGAVFLCTTGAEALYSDLGHCGRRNITASWMFVKVMLILNYLGQGAWLLTHAREAAGGINPFYAVMPQWMTLAGVAMSTGAAIIASQALLSGSFTIFSEAVNLGFWPRLKIDYPSTEKGQLYVSSVNWCLLAGCLLTVVIFRDSSHIEAAYGLAVTIAMLTTTLLLAFWLRLRGVNMIVVGAFFAFFMTVEGIFFVANMSKFVHGGWFSLMIAAVVGSIMIVWRNSTRRRASFIEYRRMADSAATISAVKADKEIPKYASNLVYLSRSGDPSLVESKLLYSIVNKQPKRADHYWFVHIDHVDSPDELSYSVSVVVPETIYVVTMHLGFRVAPRISVYLRQIVEDLVVSGDLDLRSGYPSLRREGIPGDFRFIILHRIFSPTSICGATTALLMRLHDILRHIGVSDTSAYGLDTSVVTAETVPLIINTSSGRRIVREEC
ncbi:KUP/HAK/KT family potassium transporter [Paramuribaculum intestinale]|uniref:KUP/HAK/KT family potassium transporter n=1 Tax=Paramuribaculum intestinale TaxID=2094151 RepID=UPI001F2500F3|nr:KUP/HAK/KT family potassium transporter [Paramuribaculum intestinale]MCX4329382.1 KUP/HAK/KT family potassium transporter [Paramuribaculum intestinale]WLT41894.1 KUP/HAK/KT family potassium transporter [Paramuribaculum intestinale]